MDLTDLIEIQEKELAGQKPIRLRVCTAAGCLSSNAAEVKAALERAVADGGLADKVQVCSVGCMRLCCQGPLVAADPNTGLYEKVTVEQAPSIVDALKGGTAKAQKGDANSSFFAKQF